MCILYLDSPFLVYLIIFRKLVLAASFLGNGKDFHVSLLASLYGSYLTVVVKED